MYAISAALAREMADFPGGGQALANSIYPAAQALRPMRWPAERLDTLGGYLTYHNIVLFGYMLALYGAVQGAKAIRGAETRHSLEEILATGWSRLAVVRDRALGFFAVVVVISLALGLGVAASLAAGGEPNVSGSFVTMAASGMCAMVGYALGLLVSQLTPTSRSGSAVSAILLTVLYVGTNVWEDLGPLGALRFLSPFYYANLSRALVPGYGLDAPGMLAMVAMTSVLLGCGAWAFVRRDYGSPLWARRGTSARRGARIARVQRPAFRTVWTATLFRGRVGLLVWALGAAALSGLMMGLQPTVVEAWAMFGKYFGSVGAGGISPEAWYASFSVEIVSPVIAAFVIAQAAAWVGDLEQGRVESILAAPVSWQRLVVERQVALAIGVVAIAAGSIVSVILGSAAVGAELSAAGLARLALDAVLMGVALGAVAAVIVAVFRRGAAVTVFAVFVAASYLVTYLVPLFAWPEWVNRLTVFGAFGHPYLEWPATGGLVLMLVLAIPGTLLAAALAARTPKVA